MSQNIIEEVSKLNKKISQIATKRVSVEAESQIVMRNLKQSIVKYEQKYGVSLKGKTFDEISKLVHDEYDRVEAEVKSEYELASKVVGLIEKGNVKEARVLLEKAKGSEDPVVTNEVEEEEVEASSPEPIETAEKTSEPVAEEDNEEDNLEEDDFESDDFDDPILPSDMEESEVSSESESSEQVEESEEPEDLADDDMDDVSTDDDFGFGQFLANEQAKAKEKVESTKTTPVKQAVEEMDDSFEKDDFSFDEDDDSVGDSFGFGQFLKGSKFEM